MKKVVISIKVLNFGKRVKTTLFLCIYILFINLIRHLDDKLIPFYY